MKTDLHASKSVPATASGVTGAEWRDFEDTCRAKAAQGGEQGEMAARMLDIGNRLRALSKEVEAAVERHCS